MDLLPRELWRLIQLGWMDEVFESKSFWLCAGCYTCTLRCPRGLPLTEVMGALKHMALAQGIVRERKSPFFYRAFLDNVRRNGRVRESELMGRYFLSVRNPVLPFTFLPLGLKLMTKGKLSFHFPSLLGEGKLDRIYRKAREVETSHRDVPH
jgi:heterodisulfide reductase subunit C